MPLGKKVEHLIGHTQYFVYTDILNMKNDENSEPASSISRRLNESVPAYLSTFWMPKSPIKNTPCFTATGSQRMLIELLNFIEKSL